MCYNKKTKNEIIFILFLKLNNYLKKNWFNQKLLLYNNYNNLFDDITNNISEAFNHSINHIINGIHLKIN